MKMNSAFRFLAIASAVVLWVGAVATADESAEAEEGKTPVLEAAPPAAPDADAAEAEDGGEAPAEESEESSEE